MDEPPRIEFPCSYPVKVIVQTGPDVLDEIVRIVEGYDDSISISTVTQKPSRLGNYVSVRFELWATGEPQLQALFSELKKCKAVRMVL
ncbi:MAG: DUF493 domain-containing protein [bacterium]|nr:DUF493 domain-containing protein [Gammaproteobacteria bacterium]HIL96440.1 DUF493 domain-containing protein [Pseudomonadales bacterium]